MHKLFVYGTLKKGYGNHYHIEGAELIDDGHIIGYDMLSFGAFPGAIEGEGKVYGQVYKIDDEMLQSCDYLEGYRADKPEHSMYIRTVVDCHMRDDESVEKAFVYLWNGPATYPKVEGGKW